MACLSVAYAESAVEIVKATEVNRYTSREVGMLPVVERRPVISARYRRLGDTAWRACHINNTLESSSSEI